MKIIGKTADSGFIITATESELYQLMGFASTYGLRDADKAAIGKEIKVSELYAALRVSRERKKEISDLAEALRKVAGRVDSINQALAAPIVEVEVKI